MTTLTRDQIQNKKCAADYAELEKDINAQINLLKDDLKRARIKFKNEGSWNFGRVGDLGEVKHRVREIREFSSQF